MFKNVLIFFSTLFFFSSLSFEINSLTKDQLLKTKQKFNTVNSLISKHRIKRSKINIEKYKKSRQVFNEIKKKHWNEAKKLAKNNEVLIKIIDWHFIHQNNNPKFFSLAGKYLDEFSFKLEWCLKKFFTILSSME